MALPSYQVSGRCPPLRSGLALVLGSVIFIGLGVGEQVVVEGLIGEEPVYGAALSLVLFIKAGSLIVAAALAQWLVRRGRCRAPRLAWAAGLAWGLSALLGSHSVVRAAGRWSPRLREGRVFASRRGWFEVAVPGAALPWLWLGEALLLSSVVPLAARGQARRPFLEGEGAGGWAEDERFGQLPPVSAAGVRALGRARTVGELIQSPARFREPGGLSLRFLLISRGAAGGAWLSVFDGDGRALWRMVPLTEAQLRIFLARNALEAWFAGGEGHG